MQTFFRTKSCIRQEPSVYICSPQLYKCNHFHRASKSSLLNFVVDQNKLTFGAPSNRPSASPLMLGFEEESSDLDSGIKRPKRRPIIEELD